MSSLGLDPAKASVAAGNFRILARNRGIELLNWAKEGRWNGPFSFVQAADTQFGMIDHYMRGNKEAPTWHDEDDPNHLLVDAMPGVSYKPDQVRDYKAVLTELNSDILPICVCGNHDIGDTPTPAAISQYRKDFGDDYFSFWIGGVKFLVMNSQFYHDDSLVKDLRLAHDRWMDAELLCNPNTPWKHLVGFQHIPPFVIEPNEEPVDVPGNPNLNFNYRDKEERDHP